MLTREIALARLRATGSLAPDAAPADTVDPKYVNTVLTRALQAVVINRAGGTGRAWLAPSPAHAVLP